MAEYKDLKGGKVKNYTTNPDNPYEGQVWFNETAGELRIRKGTKTTAWASGGNLNTTRDQSASTGTQTAGLVAGGNPPPSKAETELYNGSTWTEVNDLNKAKRLMAGLGTQTAGLIFGGIDGSGNNLTETESWNGSSWTETGDLNTARNGMGGAGTVPSAIGYAGKSHPSTLYDNAETWNGSAWTETADLNTARGFVGYGPNGTQTDAICVSGGVAPGTSPSTVTNTETWDGTAWYEVNDVNTSRGQLGSAGNTTACLVYGGEPANTGMTATT